MTPEQITALAISVGLDRVFVTDNKYLNHFATLIERITREACAKIVEQDLYPLPCSNYQDQYNAGVRRTAEQIRRME